MSRKIEFTDRIQPVLLPRSEDLFEGQDVIAVGWGDYSKLRWAPMHVISNLKCSEHFGPVPITNVCAQGNNKESICFGDSGGPLVLKSDNRTLIGVTSFVSIEGCSLGIPQGFSRITAYLKWIEENTGITAN